MTESAWKTATGEDPPTGPLSGGKGAPDPEAVARANAYRMGRDDALGALIMGAAWVRAHLAALGYKVTVEPEKPAPDTRQASLNLDAGR